MLNKKAAMFGLDARIALAIFGALSVITGAALYSAIKNAKVIAIVTELNEVGKAYEAFMLDTGVDLSTVDTHMNIGYLVENATPAIPDWKGPYLSYEVDTADADHDGLIHPNYVLVRLIQTTNGVWGASVAQPVCASNCYFYARFNLVPTDLAEAVDVYVDGVQDDDAGKVRIYRASATKVHLFMEAGRTLK